MEKRKRSKIDFELIEEGLKALAPLRPPTPDANATLVEAIARDLRVPPLEPFLLAPKPGPTAVTHTAPAAPQPAYKNDQVAGHKPSIGGRTFRTLACFFIVALIGVGATLVWRYHGDEAREIVRTWTPSLGWLSSVSAMKSPSGPVAGQFAQDAIPEPTPVIQTAPAPPGAEVSPELVQQFEDMVDLCHQKQMAYNAAQNRHAADWFVSHCVLGIK